MAKVGENIKVRYLGDKETGWATYLAPGLARIANVPISDNINLYDLVEIDDSNKKDLPLVTRVLKTVYPGKCFLYYAEEWQFHRLRDVLTLVGAHVEGFGGPKEGNPGRIVVAYCEDIDPVMIAEGMGIKQKTKKNGKN